MSRNGRPSLRPFSSTRIRPARSTTKTRLRSPRGAVTKIGALKLPTFFNRTPREAAASPPPWAGGDDWGGAGGAVSAVAAATGGQREHGDQAGERGAGGHPYRI